MVIVALPAAPVNDKIKLAAVALAANVNDWVVSFPVVITAVQIKPAVPVTPAKAKGPADTLPVPEEKL